MLLGKRILGFKIVYENVCKDGNRFVESLEEYQKHRSAIGTINLTEHYKEVHIKELLLRIWRLVNQALKQSLSNFAIVINNYPHNVSTLNLMLYQYWEFMQFPDTYFNFTINK